VINMATKSFLKDINIKNKNSALSLISALENAIGKSKKNVKYNVSVQNVKNEDEIKQMFNG